MQSQLSKYASSRGDHLALVVLALYITIELLFRCSSLKTSYPILVDLKIPQACEAALVALSLLAIAIKPKSLTVWQASLVALALAIMTISSNLSGDSRLFYGFLLLIVIAGADLKRLAKVYFMVATLVVATIMLMSIAQLCWNQDFIPNSRLVFSYGFNHPNTISYVLLSISGALTYYLWNENAWPFASIVSALTAAFAFIALSANASTLLLLVLALINAIGHVKAFRLSSRISGNVLFAVLVILPLCMLAVMLMAVVYYDNTNELVTWLDQMTHRRPRYGHDYYVDNDGFALLGRKYSIAYYNHSGLPFQSVDSGYYYLVFIAGIVPTCLLVVVFVIAAWRLSRRTDRLFIVAFILIEALLTLTATSSLMIYADFSIMFLSAAFASEKIDGRWQDYSWRDGRPVSDGAA